MKQSKTLQNALAAEQRCMRVLELHNQGMASRAIARTLNCDEKTVRRDLQKAKLPAQHREAIASGAAVEPVFRQASEERQRQLRQRLLERALVERPRRLAEEAQDERHSTAVATAVLYWLAEHGLVPAEEERIMLDARKELWMVKKWRNRATWPRMPAECLPLPTDAEKDPGQNCVLMEYCITTLVEALPLLAPEMDIRDEAMNKILNSVTRPGARTEQRIAAARSQAFSNLISLKH